MTKKHWIIIAIVALVIIVICYFCFKKKNTESKYSKGRISCPPGTQMINGECVPLRYMGDVYKVKDVQCKDCNNQNACRFPEQWCVQKGCCKPGDFGNAR